MVIGVTDNSLAYGPKTFKLKLMAGDCEFGTPTTRLESVIFHSDKAVRDERGDKIPSQQISHISDSNAFRV